MKTKIKNIANIQTGIYEKPEPNGEVYYIQARHFDENRTFIKTVKPDLHDEARLQRHFLQVGDVLVASKGYNLFAIDYKGIIKPAVASSMFIVLRLFDANVLPEYLAWYINQPKIQSVLSEKSKGTDMPSITKSDIGELPIFIPAIAKQKMILEIQELMNKEHKIIDTIKELREKQTQQLILNFLNEK